MSLSKANFQIIPDLLRLTPMQLWAANQVNVPTASPAIGYQSDSDYGYGDSSPEYTGEIQTSFLDDLNENFPDANNTEAIKKECLGNDDLIQDMIALGLMSKMPNWEFFYNLDESTLKDTDESTYTSYNNCSPKSPGESSCDDGYNSDEILEILSNGSASPAPTEASPEEAYLESALLPSPKQEEVQVVPTSPAQPLSQPLSKPIKPARTSGRRKRGPRSLTLNNGNGPLQLWQFLLKLLTEGPKGLVQWTHDEPFEFKLLKPTAVATMWGKVKNKPSMNYEKLSRGLRYYYGKKILEKVHGKRYVYQFQCDIPKILGYDPTSTDPKQNVEDAVCDSPDVAYEISDSYEECPSSVSSEGCANECWEIGPGLW